MSTVLEVIHRLVAEHAQPRPLLANWLRERFSDDPNRDRVDELLEFVFDGTPPAWHGLVVSPEDASFVDSLRALPQDTGRTPAGLIVRRGPSVRTIRRTEDALAAVRPDTPSLLCAVNAVANLVIQPRRTTAVVTSARDEGISMLEWLAHYRVLGFDHVFVYTNDNIDGSEGLLTALANHGAISLILNEIAPNVAPQRKCYNHAVHVLRDLRDYEWALFVDTDELLMLHPRFAHAVRPYLRAAQNAVGSTLSAICFHWRWFGSSRAFARTEGLMMERFQQGHANRHVKSFIRLRDALSMHDLHVPSLPAGRTAVTSGFQPMALHPELPTDYSGGQLNHYWNKSFQEFVFKRMRGDGSLDECDQHKDFETFFVWGQAERPEEPTAPGIVARVKQEIQDLLGLPGVRDAAHEVERRFQERLTEHDRRLGLRQLYDQYMRRYA